MKKIVIMAAIIAVIATFISCSKQHGEYISATPSLSEQSVNKVPKNPNGIVTDSQDQEGDSNELEENSVSSFGSGDDDKPIIMHRILASTSESVPSATVTMINKKDTLQAVTDLAGECTITLPRVGVWKLRVALGLLFSFDTSISVTDSFSLRTTTLQYP